jgi:hypothetical protein
MSYLITRYHRTNIANSIFFLGPFLSSCKLTRFLMSHYLFIYLNCICFIEIRYGPKINIILNLVLFYFNKHGLKNLFLSVFGLDSFGPKNLIPRAQSKREMSSGLQRVSPSPCKKKGSKWAMVKTLALAACMGSIIAPHVGGYIPLVADPQGLSLGFWNLPFASFSSKPAIINRDLVKQFYSLLDHKLL